MGTIFRLAGAVGTLQGLRPPHFAHRVAEPSVRTSVRGLLMVVTYMTIVVLTPEPHFASRDIFFLLSVCYIYCNSFLVFHHAWPRR